MNKEYLEPQPNFTRSPLVGYAFPVVDLQWANAMNRPLRAGLRMSKALRYSLDCTDAHRLTGVPVNYLPASVRISKSDINVVLAPRLPWECGEGVHRDLYSDGRRFFLRPSCERVARVENESERVRGMELSFLDMRFAVHSPAAEVYPDIDTSCKDQQRSHDSGR